MPPEYHSVDFWDKRFNKEDHFEWLGDGRDSIIPPFITFLQNWDPPGGPNEQPRFLHIGAGSSTLQSKIYETYCAAFGDQYADGSRIVNVDFSETAVMKGRAEQLEGRQAQRWERADLLRWTDVQRLCEDGALFDVIMDKSTSDAISCGGKIDLESAMPCSRLVQDQFNALASTSQRATLEPVEVLALNLAEIVLPGGIWIALSYSRERFWFLSQGAIGIARFWTMESVAAVDAPSGLERPVVYTPKVQHWIYVLRRSASSA